MNETKKKGVSPSLSYKQKEKIVEEIIGVHPRYLIKSGLKLIVDVQAMANEGKTFNGFKHKELFY